MRKLLIYFALAAASAPLLAQSTPQTLPSAPQPQIAGQTAKPAARDLSDWNRLYTLDPDSNLSVKADHRGPIHCQDVSLDSSGLSCEARIFWVPIHTYNLPRADVQVVRLRHDKRYFWIGEAVVVSAGFALGASQPDNFSTQSRTANGFFIGALSGLAFSPLVRITTYLIPGEVIYRRK